jgi:two-component system LytT family response regulator
MRIVVVEDEPPARAKLISAIRESAPDGDIIAELSGVAETVHWLQHNPPPDLVFLDIQLSDGLSFEIFRRVRMTCPVIFATAFDEYILEALHSNGIDYLLKPVRVERVAASIDKFRRLREHFVADYTALADSIARPRTPRDRLLVRKGVDLVPVRTNEIAYLFTRDKLVFLITRTGVRYMLDRPLSELESELDIGSFFRANRAYVVSADAVVRCRPYGKGKLLLEVRPPAEEEIIVSQERAAAFREWLGE